MNWYTFLSSAVPDHLLLSPAAHEVYSSMHQCHVPRHWRILCYSVNPVHCPITDMTFQNSQKKCLALLVFCLPLVLFMKKLFPCPLPVSLCFVNCWLHIIIQSFPPKIYWENIEKKVFRCEWKNTKWLKRANRTQDVWLCDSCWNPTPPVKGKPSAYPTSSPCIPMDTYDEAKAFICPT